LSSLSPPAAPAPLEPVAWVPLAPPASFWRDWGRHLLLFVLTAASVFLCDGLALVRGADGALHLAWDVGAGLRLAAAVMSILLAHEMGHYLACRYYGVSATLPFFLPAPIINPLVGTFGAVIRIQSPFPHRRALFDIGIAGPLAGFAVCLPVLVLGLLEAQVVPRDPSAFGLLLAQPLIFKWAAAWVLGPVPAGSTLLIGPFGMAAWFGLLITALNLIPIGQLDGGHVTYALFRGRAERLSRLVWWLCVAMIVLIGPSFILWTLLVRVLGLRHPRTLDDEAPLGRARVLVALLGLAVFILCFVPDPFRHSWRDFFEAWSG
jgi:membrane-associated protease RseP (regulator of RpoE activity)